MSSELVPKALPESVVAEASDSEVDGCMLVDEVALAVVAMVEDVPSTGMVAVTVAGMVTAGLVVVVTTKPVADDVDVLIEGALVVEGAA